VLNVNEYMSLMWCRVGEGRVVVCGLVSCIIVLLLLKVTLTFVFLNRLVIFLTCGKECVKVAHFVSFVEAVGRCGWLSFFCILRLNFDRRWMGMLLLHAVSLMLLHSLCCHTSLRGSESILFIKNLQAVSSCSRGWLERNLMVVSVVVGWW
jgi:hypothetical protein